MSSKKKLIESGITKIVKKVMKESKGAVDLNKVDRSNLDTNASTIIDSLIAIGARGKYDPSSGSGIVDYRGYQIAFETGGENFYFKIGDKSIGDRLYTKDVPKKTAQAIKQFIDFISNYA